MKDRIKQIIEDQQLTQQSFANLTGINPATLSGLFNGRTQPTLKVVEAIKKTFPTLNLEWLMYGTPPMYISKPTSGSEEGSGLVEPSAAHPTPAEASLDFEGSSPQVAPSLFSQPNVPSVNNTPKKVAQAEVKYIDKPQRKITEIRIFYDDQTWETFVPKK